MHALEYTLKEEPAIVAELKNVRKKRHRICPLVRFHVIENVELRIVKYKAHFLCSISQPPRFHIGDIWVGTIMKYKELGIELAYDGGRRDFFQGRHIAWRNLITKV